MKKKRWKMKGEEGRNKTEEQREKKGKIKKKFYKKKRCEEIGWEWWREKKN